MSLIKSISGIRGTIGGAVGENLTPPDIVNAASAFGAWILTKNGNRKIVLGRDARISGEMVSRLVTGALQGMGIDVVDLGLSTTPTVEMAVPMEKAGGGIILTASHNPREWNALKLLNEKGEFISDAEGKDIIHMATSSDFFFADVDNIGSYRKAEGYLDQHIAKILDLPLVHTAKIREKKFKIVADVVNSTGTLALQALCQQLQCHLTLINSEMTGDFAHNPEPLPEHLSELCKRVTLAQADLGIAVDPDVDRLALVDEHGQLFGEEYTLVAVADYVLSHKPGPTVSNLSSTKALGELTKQKYEQSYLASAVGEVNVVAAMKESGAVIGGEGNGGIIYPDLHYGRDALVGIALFLSQMAESGKSASAIRKQYPDYVIRKNRMDLAPKLDLDALFVKLSDHYKDYPQLTIDGLKIIMPTGWIHLRKSNTEPIIRIYSEAETAEAADHLAIQVKSVIEKNL